MRLVELSVEFQLVGNEQLDALGDVEVTLPSWVTMLPQEQLNEIAHAPGRGQLIVAAGRDKDDDDIVIMTGDGRLMSVPAGDLPRGRATPSDWGHGLTITVIHESSVGWVLASAEPLGVDLLSAATYGDEDHE